jgi:DNA-binding NtrC family response regulator
MSVGQKRILLVEDEPSIRLLLVDSLEDAGFDVLEAANGDEAACLLVYLTMSTWSSPTSRCRVAGMATL